MRRGGLLNGCKASALEQGPPDPGTKPPSRLSRAGGGCYAVRAVIYPWVVRCVRGYSAPAGRRCCC